MDNPCFSFKSNVDKFFDLPEEQTAADYILRKCKQFSCSDHPCITNPVTKESIEYSEVERLSGNVSTFLQENGFQPGDIILNLSHNGAKLHVFFLGVWRAGGIIQCSYPEDLGDVLTDRIVKSQAKFVICDEGSSEDCLAAASSERVISNVSVLVFGKASGCISLQHLFSNDHHVQAFRNVPRERHDEVLLLPTSGTTGASKFVTYTNEILIKNIILFEHFPFTNDSTLPSLITGKQTHFTGSICPLAFMTAGRNLLMMTQVNLRTIFQVVQSYKVKSIFSFPSYLTGLVLDSQSSLFDCSSIEFVFTAGLVVGQPFQSTVQKLPNVKSIVTIYGMTEVGLLTSTVDWVENGSEILACIDNPRSISCGRLLPGATVAIRDINTGNFTGSGQRGELCFKNDLVCPGYWKNEECSKSTFKEGWIFTGDWGYYDEHGNIYVLNRIKEVFKYFNNHITPSEIENVIREHPAVSDACVVGIPDPDEGGTIPRAFITLVERPYEDNSADPDKILQYTNDKLASYKKLKGGLYVIQAFPKGKSGKILRNELSNFNIS